MPRRAAIEALTAVDARDAFSNVALDRALKRAQLSPRDARLATEIVYGVLERRRFLDHALDRWLKKPIRHLDPFGRAALRAGAYQILFTRVPARAAISETVAVAKKRGAWRGGLTNAVLRRVSEHLEELQAAASAPATDAATLGLRFGLPDDLAAGLIERLGLERAIEYGQAIREAPPVTLRLRPPARADHVTAALEAAGARVEPGGVAPRALRVRGGGSPGSWTAVRRRRAVVQDEGSQLVGLLLAPSADSRVLDLCAGRGGKTFHLADLLDVLGGTGQVVAFDEHPDKLGLLEREASRLGLANVIVHRPDDGPLQDLAPFDAVLVDAPCTGVGNLRRHPELRWKWSAERLARLQDTQRELLDRAADLVRPGGLLVYSVCSDWPGEGVAQVDALLARRHAFARAALPPSVDWQAVATPEGDLLLEPHRHDTDGFFAARLRRDVKPPRHS